MDNNNPHRPRDPRSSFHRTPLKHNSSSPEEQQDRNERGYPYNNTSHRQQQHNRNNSSITSPPGGSGGFTPYSSLGGGFGHYGRTRETGGSFTRPAARNNNGNTPSSNKEHHVREREKEREMMSIYGRGEETSAVGGGTEPHLSRNNERESSVGGSGKKYHNPCRFTGHDHEWRDCPNNYRNKNKRASFIKYQQPSSLNNEYNKKEEIRGEVVPHAQGIGKSTSWSQAGGDYYGPASEGGGGRDGGGGGNKNSDWHDNRDNSTRHDGRDMRGYKPNDNKGSYQDLQPIGSRSKSFGGEGSTHERGNNMDRGFDIDNESTSGTVESDHSERKRHEYSNRQERGNFYSPAPVFKPRASPTATSLPNPNQHERGYSSNSFASLSVGGPRRGSVQLNPHVPVPPFSRSQSYDSQSVRDTKKEYGEEGGDASFYRKLATSSSFSRRDGMESEQLKADHKVAPPQSHGAGSPSRGHEDFHRLNSNSSAHDKSLTDEGPVHARSGSKVFATTDATPTPSTASKPQSASVTPFLTCAELGAAEKVSKAEEIVSKMNALMKKPLDDMAKSDATSSPGAIRLPSKNEILKCMAVIDGKIKVKDDESAAVKKKIKEIEQEKIAEEERLAKLDKEKRQSLLDGVTNLKSERRDSIQTKEDDLMKAIDAQRASIQDSVADELLQLESKCSDALKTNAAKLNSEISLIQNQVEEAEMAIEEMDVPLASCQEEDGDFVVDESYFVPTLDAPGKMASLISSVIEDNQRIAAEAHHESLAAIPYFPQSEEELAATRNSPTSVVTNEEWSNRARKVTGLHDALYTDPSDVPMFKENNESFLELGPQIKECIRVKKKKLKKRWEDLANQYLVRQMAFNEETGVNETSERGGFFSITGRVDESGEIQPLGNVRGNNPYRRPRRGVSPGDVVRSEYEQEQIIAEIAAKEAMEKRIKEGGCALPHQRGVVENSLFASFSNGFLGNRVEDFMEDEEERRNVNVWTDMEKCIFFDRFLHHPKDFRKISSFLRNKTTKDCIAFYYNSKKTIPYKHALKEFLQRKKRHGAVVGWDATIQAALSVGAIIKPGESPEKPLKFVLPQNDYTYRTHPFHPMQMEVLDNLEAVALNSKHHDEVKSKPKRSNWFILDASSRKYIKHHKDDKEQSLKRKSSTLSDAEMEDVHLEKKVQRAANMSDVHANEEKKSAKAIKWKADEKKLFFEAVEKFGHNWGKVSEYVGTRTMSQVKNFFYDNKKQVLRKKEKGEKSGKSATTEEISKKKFTKEKNATLAEKQQKQALDLDTNTNQSVQDSLEISSQPDSVQTDYGIGLCMPVNQEGKVMSAEEQYHRQILHEQQNQQYIQQQLQQQHHLQQQQQQHFLHQQMQRMHDAQRLQEAQRMEDARQRHQEEMMRQQWLAQLQQQQHHQQQQQGNDWADQQNLHTIQSILALQQEQGSGYQGNGNGQASDAERMFQERMRVVAAAAAAGIPQSSIEAALARQNENQGQQQHAANFELYQRLQQHHQQQQLQQQHQQHQQDGGHPYGGSNDSYSHYHHGGR